MNKIKLLLFLLSFAQILGAQTFTPADFGPALWLDASDTTSVVHTAGLVSIWNDISGNNNHASQATTINQPYYINTSSGIEFNGTGDVLIGNNLGYGSDTTITLFIVAAPDAGADKGSVIAKGQWTSGNDYRIELGEHGYDVAVQNARKWNSSSNDWNIAHKNMFRTYYDSIKTVGYYLNGGRVESPRTNVPYNPNNSPYSIGARFTYNNFFTGKIYEVLLYQKELNICETEQIEGYLFRKWGLQAYIISNHSFKDRPFGICSEIAVDVDENSANNTFIDTIIGVYVDTAVTFTDWRIEDGGIYENTFALSSTGVLTVNDNTHLDYETASAFNIEVSALAGGIRVYGGVLIDVNDLADGGTQKIHSELWGSNGEKWDSRGRLPDFSYVGYKSGEENYHYVNNTADVTDFGADPTDSISDHTAIINAIASIDSGIVYFPAGLYVIDDYVTISKDNIVLRGAGNDSISGTRFYLPKSSSELSGTYSYILQFTGSLSGPKHFLTESVKMGDRSITLNNVSGLNVGEFVELGFSGSHPSDGELWDHILNDQNADWPCSVAWSTGNGGLIMMHTIERIEGNIITLKEPIRLDMKLSWTPHLIRRTDWFVKNCGIEDIFITHKHIPKPPHLQEPGYNSISFSRSINCWINNVSIKDADNGIRFDVSCFSEIINISFYGRSGHHGWTFAYSSHCFADSIHFNNYDAWTHSLTLTHKSSGNVVSNITGIAGIAISTDFHRNTPWETLITNVENTWNYNSSGVWCAGPNAGKRTVYWNMGGDGFTSYPNWDEYQTTLVGDMHIPEQFMPEKGWHENVPGIEPANLHIAQFNRRLTLPADPPFTSDIITGKRSSYWERDPSRWEVENGAYQLHFSETPGLSGGRLGEYAILDSLFTSDMVISADIKSLEKININPMADAALIVNYQDDNNYYFSLFSATGGQSGIYKVQNGTASSLKLFDIVFTNDTVSYAFENKNGMLIFHENGASIESIVDVSFTGGKVGFGTIDDAASFDNISIANYCKDYILIKDKIFDFNRTYNAANTIVIEDISVQLTKELTLNAPKVISNNQVLLEGKLLLKPIGCIPD